MVDELITMAQIAERYGRTRNTVYSWRHRGLLPEPHTVIDNKPVWRSSQFDQWFPPAPTARSATGTFESGDAGGWWDS